MKTVSFSLFVFSFSFLLSVFAFGQKRDIDTDVLLPIIEQKQKEVAQRALLNYARIQAKESKDYEKSFISLTLIPLLSQKNIESISEIVIKNSLEVFSKSTHSLGVVNTGGDETANKKFTIDYTLLSSLHSHFADAKDAWYARDKANRRLNKAGADKFRTALDNILKELEAIGQTDNKSLNFYTETLKLFLENVSLIEVKPFEYVITLDVPSVILELYEKYSDYKVNNRMTFTLPVRVLFPKVLFSIGANVGFLGSDQKINYFASEKIGLKSILYDWNYTRSQPKGKEFIYGGVWKRMRAVRHVDSYSPLVHEVHLMAYGSGLLYNIANLKSTNMTNDPILGYGIGLKFYNGLGLNVSLASQVPNSTLSESFGRNTFVNVGFDIPIIEYLSALRKKE